ncbi:MAG TPA: DNA internalization-related competence protein ComEC/Rec2 [Gammaproteobacteria bacterium]|nr:DNA internalization-related competence protein ComEC/Rec2 [Gammaproteobacteria bacterium]
MYAGTIAFLLGVLALQQRATLPHPSWALLIPFLLPWMLRRGRWRLPATALTGFLWAALYGAWLLYPGLDPALEGRDLALTGCVTGIPERRERSVRFVLRDLRRAGAAGATTLPKRIRLSWYHTRQAVHAGDCWQLTVRLKRPHGYRNPGGFDYEGWLFRRGVRATGYVRPDPGNHRSGRHWTLDRMRATLAARIDAALGARPLAGVIRALAVGDRQGISREQWSILSATGTSHLVAISGLHIGLVAGLAFFLVGRLWAWPGSTVRYCAAPRVAALGALAAALVYALLAGLSLPTRRALIMVAVAMGSLWRSRTLAPGRSLCLALLVVLVAEPTAVCSAGFWLSFGAVAVILYGASGRLRGTRSRLAWAGLQLRVGVGLLPLLVIGAFPVGLLAPLANLVAVPWVGFVVVPLTLTGSALLGLSPALGTTLLRWAEQALEGLWPVLTWLAQIPGGHWILASPPAWTWGLAVLGTALLLAPRGWPGRWLGAVYLLPLLSGGVPAPEPGAVRFTLLDVGQGLAVVVRTHRHALVFDTGPRLGPGFDTGAAVVVPYLRSQGVGRVDRLVVSHGDNDHIGGVASLLEQIPVTDILSSVPERIPAAAGRCRRGQHWEWDGVAFEVLHPGAGHRFRGNNASCVLRVSNGAGALLITGDIEAPAERALVNEAARALRAEWMTVPHHGSRTSSTRRFLKAVRPGHALIPVGYRNRFRLPNRAVVARYRAVGIALLDSVREGAITVDLDAHRGSRWAAYRRQEQHYWHWRPADPLPPGPGAAAGRVPKRLRNQ